MVVNACVEPYMLLIGRGHVEVEGRSGVGLSGVQGRCTSLSITRGLTPTLRFERVIMEFACT